MVTVDCWLVRTNTVQSVVTAVATVCRVSTSAADDQSGPQSVFIITEKAPTIGPEAIIVRDGWL